MNTNPLLKALDAMDRYDELRNRDSSHAAEMALQVRDYAAVWAAIAQAQALERISATLLEINEMLREAHDEQ